MTRRVWISVLTAALLSLPVVSAQTVKAPPGWKSQNQSGATMLTPSNLPAGKAVTMLVFPPQPLNGQPLKAWAEKIFKQGAAQYGKALQPGQTVYNDPTWSYAQLIEVSGKPFALNFFAFSAGSGKAQLVSLLMSSDKALINQYNPAIASVLVGLIKGGSAPAVASSTTKPPTSQPSTPQPATGSVALATEYGLPSGSRVGGKLQIGTYTCSRPGRAGDETRRFNLDIYGNGQWRQAMNGKQLDWSKYEYSASTGKITISMGLKLYNSEFDKDVLSIYYTDAQGRPVIYGEDDYGLGVDKTTCLYAGPNRLPSPTDVMAQEAKKKAAEEAARAEANRFKWITAPGKGVQLNQIQAILYTAELNTSSGYSMDEDWVLLLRDGWAYTGLRVSPHDLDVKKSRQNEPGKWLKWRKQGGDYQSLNPKTGKWQEIEGSPVLPAAKGERISGLFQNYSTYSAGDWEGAYKSATTLSVNFSKDGKFSTSSYGIGGVGSGDTSSTSVNTANQSGCTSTTSTTARAGNSQISTQNPTVLAGGSSSSGCNTKNFTATYTLDGYTIERRYPDGSVTRQLFFFRDARKDKVFVGSMSYTRK